MLPRDAHPQRSGVRVVTLILAIAFLAGFVVKARESTRRAQARTLIRESQLRRKRREAIRDADVRALARML